MASSRTSKVLALSLGQGLTTFVTLVSGMVMTRVLSQAELATYRQTLLAYQVAVPLLSLGLPQAIYYFLPAEEKRKRGLLVDALVMLVCMGFVYAVFIALGGNYLLARRFSNPAIVRTLVYLVPLPLIMLPAGLLSSVMVVQDRVKSLAVFNVLNSLSLAVGVISACLIWKTPEAMIFARVSVSVMLGLFAIGLMLRAIPHNSGSHASFRNMRAMVSFSIPLVVAGALGTISLQLDKIIVSSMCTPEAFAVYSVAAMEIPLIGIVTGSISRVILVDFRKAFVAGDYASAVRLYRLVPEKTTIFLFPTMVYLGLAAKPFICVLFSETYIASAPAFMIYLLVIPSRTILLNGMAAVGKNKIVLRISAVGLLLNLVLSILLVRSLGYLGAVIGTVIVLALWAIPMVLLEVSRSLGVSIVDSYPWKTVGRNFLLALIAGGPTYFVLLAFRGWPWLVQLVVSVSTYGCAYIGALDISGVLSVKSLIADLHDRVHSLLGRPM